ncbi:ABC transporter [Agrococcus sp. SGAir0287]|uniref:ABC transporter n=1 Tax=Agrococcus sp. SGAir0287 TaxID=2070347 RepID=UPI0010CCE61B|nr:ABC transporter [Agrococcus sp. SGAir0287]QCR18307.1 ABC transporter [Agrococcus sp. SGAir0287]
MPPRHRASRTALPLAAASALLALVACSTGSGDEPDAEPTPHGYVEGASEVEEPQLGLLGITDAGVVTLLDLLSEESTHVGEIGPVEQTADDGRFVAASTDGGVAIVDSGVWTVEHGDHDHYYRAQPQVAATIDGEGPVRIASTELVTVVLAQGSGEVVVLDRAALGQGEATEIARFDADAVAAIPLGDGIVLADDASVRIVDQQGEDLGPDAACTNPADALTTRVGVAVACDEGAVLATAAEAPIEAIPYPAGTDPSTIATTLDGRPGRPSVAAVAGTTGFWLLDTRERSWTLVPTSTPLAHVAAVDDADEHVVAVAIDGRILALDATGAELGATDAVLADAIGGGGTPVIDLDASRAYVPSADGTVLEIDYADGARVARTLVLDAAFVAEVGR